MPALTVSLGLRETRLLAREHSRINTTPPSCWSSAQGTWTRLGLVNSRVEVVGSLAEVGEERARGLPAASLWKEEEVGQQPLVALARCRDPALGLGTVLPGSFFF